MIANELIEGYISSALLADKAYGSEKIISKALEQGMEIVIPSKSNSLNPRIIDKHKYKNRGLIENLFQRLKVFRRISTRYEKLDKNFLSFTYLACIFKWLH